MSAGRRWALALAGAAVITLAIILVFLFGGRIGRQLAIDACLDRGGAWDYERAQCQT